MKDQSLLAILIIFIQNEQRSLAKMCKVNKNCDWHNWWIFLRLLSAQRNNITVWASNLQPTLWGTWLALFRRDLQTLLMTEQLLMRAWVWTPLQFPPLSRMEVGVDWLSCYPGVVWEPIRKRAHTQVSATVVSARWATVDWFWHKKWN